MNSAKKRVSTEGFTLRLGRWSWTPVGPVEAELIEDQHEYSGKRQIFPSDVRLSKEKRIIGRSRNRSLSSGRALTSHENEDPA